MQNPNSLLSQLNRALQNGDAVFTMSGGEQVRDYLLVEKVAAKIVAIALQLSVTGIINYCSGKGITVKEFVQNYLNQKQKHPFEPRFLSLYGLWTHEFLRG